MTYYLHSDSAYERDLLWLWSVANVIYFEWSVISGLLWTGHHRMLLNCCALF